MKLDKLIPAPIVSLLCYPPFAFALALCWFCLCRIYLSPFSLAPEGATFAFAFAKTKAKGPRARARLEGREKLGFHPLRYILQRLVQTSPFGGIVQRQNHRAERETSMRYK